MKSFVPSGRAVARMAAALTTAATFAVGLSGAFAADHRDGDAVKLTENIPADINDVYAFKAGDKLVFAMTVFPFADANAQFSDAAVYAINVGQHASFGAAATGTVDILCTFDADQVAQCWIGDDYYVTGDASDPMSPIESDDGAVRVFAGLRADPFYFYLTGFNAARGAVQGAFGGLSLHPNGCPIVDATTAAGLRDLIEQINANDFADANTLAIVVEADESVFADATNPVLSVYGSTHVKQ